LISLLSGPRRTHRAPPGSNRSNRSSPSIRPLEPTQDRRTFPIPFERFKSSKSSVIDWFRPPLYTRPMKLSISEARRRLPELVRRVRKNAGAKVEITVRDEVAAELRAALPEPEPGAAAKKLVELMRRLPKHRGRKTDISAHVKEHLYGSAAKSR